MVKLTAACSMCVGSGCVHMYQCEGTEKCWAFVLFSIKTLEGTMDLCQQNHQCLWIACSSWEVAPGACFQASRVLFFGSPLSSASA